MVKMDDMQMFDQTKSKRSATSPSHSCCIATLLSIIAILLSGIFASLCVLTYHVVPLLKASQPIVASVDPVAIKPYIVKAGVAVDGAAQCGTTIRISVPPNSLCTATAPFAQVL